MKAPVLRQCETVAGFGIENPYGGTGTRANHQREQRENNLGFMKDERDFQG